MSGTFRAGTAILLLLIAGILTAGCSSDQAPADLPALSSTAPQPKYSAGDIIARPAQATGEACYLILGYDRAGDQYTRAWVYRNADGNFGYRADSRTDSGSRTTVEKIYPVKLAHVSIAAIPVLTPTTATPVKTPASGSTAAPEFLAISPATGAKDSTVSASITGSNFADGATVKLLQPGYSPVKATAVSVQSPSVIDCTFSLSGLEKGSLTVIITNPDGQSVSAPGVFTIVAAGPVITSVYPPGLKAGETGRLTIYGQNFQELSKISITQGSSEINCMSPDYSDATKITCDLSVPASAALGSWNLSIINVADQRTGRYAKPFIVANST